MEVFSMLNVIERIQTDYPDVEIVSIGEQDFVVQLLDAPMAPKWLETLKVVVDGCSNLSWSGIYDYGI